MNYIYSIIIPHYNIPELLVRCLKSIPVREDIQVIVVDDCSPNADTYKERFPEIFSRPNLEWYSTSIGGSAGRARNIGLEHASGKWVLFADADDFYVPNMYEILSSHANDDVDVIYFKADSVDTITLLPSDRHLGRNESLDLYISGEASNIEAILHFTVVWSTMYSKKFIIDSNIKFDATLCGNDIMFAVKAAHKSQKYKYIDEILYVITYRENSLHDSKTKSYQHYVTQHSVDARLCKYCKQEGINYKKPPCVLRDIYITYTIFGVKAAIFHFKMALKDKALTLGLKEYLVRKIL